MNKVALSILVVDDDYVTRFIHQKVIESLTQFTITQLEANNGLEALRIVKNLAAHGKPLPNLILLDIDMPVLDGFGFIDAFQKIRLPNSDKVDIVIVSSSRNPKDLKRSYELGINIFFTKPISVEQLVSVILRNSRAAA